MIYGTMIYYVNMIYDEHCTQSDQCCENILASFRDRDFLINFTDIIEDIKLKLMIELGILALEQTM